ncbi:MAG: hypothetical protein WEF51_05260 [Chloroflexota bacterium]
MTRRVLPALIAVAALAAIAVLVFWWGRDAAGDRLVETGVVVEVDAAGLTEVLGFTLRTSDGRTIEFVVGPLENPAEFPPSHLGVHLASGEPVRVTYKQDGTDRVAVRLEDAPGSP